MRYSAEPLEQRVMLSAATGSQYPELITTAPKKGHAVHGSIDTTKFAIATAIPIAPVAPIESGSPISPIVNGVVYSNMAQTGLSVIQATSGVIGNDDYNSINDANITLTQMKFIGGVTVANGVLDFEFFDSSAAFVTAFAVQLTQAGDFIYTITPASPPTIPDQGFLQIAAESGTTGRWYRGTTEPSVGTQTGGTPAFRFEFTNTSPNQAPIVTSFTDTPDPVAVNGTVTFNASANDPDGSVSQVNFYRESNSIGGLQVGGDTLIGTDTTSPYSLNFNTTGLPAGYYKYYATATDNLALEGAAASTQNTIGFGTVTGTKWNDLNNNGVLDAGEPGLSGVTVFVDYNDNTTLDAGEPSTTTLANGTYTINNVTPGSYIVREVVPGGFTQTSPGVNGAILDQSNGVSGEPLDPTPLYDTPVANYSTTASSNGPDILPIWAPGTPQKTVDDFYAKQTSANPVSSLLSGISPFTFNDADRWSETATNGAGLVQGQPITLTWHVVADGTPIPGFNGEPAGNSNLQAFLNGIYGSSATWLPLFTQIFNEWGSVTGINYVVEANDDGSSFSDIDSASTKGVLGVRADIRIGGHFIDGNSNVLAYDFFPNVSDMVIDTGDNFFSNNAGGTNLGIRNVLSHEHGHGLGLQHVEPVDQTKLMEPFVSFAFDGPQPDDILAANRGYGDPLEKSGGNDTSGTATNLGALSNGTVTQNGVSIDDDSDIDFYKFTAAAAKRATITVNPVGSTYLSGTQGGPAPTPFDASSQSDLSVQLIASDGVTVLKTANNFPAGSSEQIFSAALGAGGQFFIKVTGAANAAQMYQLQAQIQNAAAGGTSVYAGPNATVSNVNFGNHSNVGSGGISGQVYEDRNGDSSFNGTDVAMNGVTVFLDTNNNGSLDGGESSVVTSGAGNYSFTSLSAGTYHLKETIPAGYIAVNPANGAVDVIVAASTVNQNLGNFPITYGGGSSNNTFAVSSLVGGSTTQIISTIAPAGPITYTIARTALGTNPLTFNGNALDDALTIDMTNGNPLPNSGGAVYNAGAQNSADTLTVIGTSGADTANFAGGVIGNGAGTPINHFGSVEAITYDGAGGNDNISLSGGPPVTFPTSQHFASLSITAGLAVLAANGSRFINTGSLLISGTGRLDLKDNDLIARGGNVGSFSGGFYNGITGLIATGRNGGAWNGATGIITTSASGNFTTLGVATFQQAKALTNPTDTTTYAGETVTGNDVLVKFTYGGDANLDGKINVDDYGKIDFNVALGTKGWFNGDFNYDGKINVDDYGIIDFNIGIQGPPL